MLRGIVLGGLVMLVLGVGWWLRSGEPIGSGVRNPEGQVSTDVSSPSEPTPPAFADVAAPPLSSPITMPPTTTPPTTTPPIAVATLSEDPSGTWEQRIARYRNRELSGVEADRFRELLEGHLASGGDEAAEDVIAAFEDPSFAFTHHAVVFGLTLEELRSDRIAIRARALLEERLAEKLQTELYVGGYMTLLLANGDQEDGEFVYQLLDGGSRSLILVIERCLSKHRDRLPIDRLLEDLDREVEGGLPHRAHEARLTLLGAADDPTVRALVEEIVFGKEERASLQVRRRMWAVRAYWTDSDDAATFCAGYWTASSDEHVGIWLNAIREMRWHSYCHITPEIESILRHALENDTRGSDATFLFRVWPCRYSTPFLDQVHDLAATSKAPRRTLLEHALDLRK